MAYTNGSFCLRHFLEILDVKAVVFFKKNGTFLSKEIVLFTDLFLKTILLRILLLKQTWIPLLIQI